MNQIDSDFILIVKGRSGSMLLPFLIQISPDKKKEIATRGVSPPYICGSLQNAPTSIK
jgi:hypothetical protein